MASVIFRQKAIDDLNSIWNYTYEKWSESQADKYYTAIKLACKELGENTAVGKQYQGISKNLLGLKNRKAYHILSNNFY